MNFNTIFYYFRIYYILNQICLNFKLSQSLSFMTKSAPGTNIILLFFIGYWKFDDKRGPLAHLTLDFNGSIMALDIPITDS